MIWNVVSKHKRWLLLNFAKQVPDFLLYTKLYIRVLYKIGALFKSCILREDRTIFD